jgi:glycosyltransferase involved in cell wall biosynthesis
MGCRWRCGGLGPPRKNERDFTTGQDFLFAIILPRGMPKALLEAKACGLPCITTNAPGCRDAVRHEDNGLLVPIKDAEALAEAIKRLLQNPAERLRMGARGRERAEKEFNQEIIIQQTLNVYREMIIAG